MKAVLQVADTGPVESLVVMLRSIGIECYYCSPRLRAILRNLGCNNVLEIDTLVRSWGYEKPMPLPDAEPSLLSRKDTIFIDVKAQKNAELMWKVWPNLKGKTIWYRINGCEPENVPGHGNEVDPICPTLTPNLWYGLPNKPWSPKSYAFYPPFYRIDEMQAFNIDRMRNFKGRVADFSKHYFPPISLIHNVEGWGYRDLIPKLREQLGVKCHGVNSPDRLIGHRESLVALTKTLALIHPKPSDAPGYTLYESLAIGCPIIVSRRLIQRCLMQNLLEDGVTCLAFDNYDKKEYSSQDVIDNIKEIEKHLKYISNPENNVRIGEAGRERLKSLMWSETNPTDKQNLINFMKLVGKV